MSVATYFFVCTQFFLVIALLAFAMVHGCGPILPAQVPTTSFTASGFTVPAEMAFSENAMVQSGITSISRSRDAAIRVVVDLVMNGVNDVLQEQGRNALLPDPLIMSILQQLNVTIEYTPLNCPTATTDPMNGAGPPQEELLMFTQLFIVIGSMCSMSVFGCGTFLPGQASAINFTASSFTLPPQMAYSETLAVQTAITSISRSREAAIRVVNDLIMNAVNEVLQEQGRNALLPDPVISVILQQLNITIEYTPLNCPTATNNPMNNMPPMAENNGCLIINDVVIGLCTTPAAACMLLPAIMNVMPTPSQFRTIRGSLRTSNAIMATWSRQMWQSILNRVLQRIASGQFAKYFNTAIVTVNN